MKHENGSCLTPCSNCPWRRDSPRTGIGTTLSIYHHCQDDGIRAMLCHKSPSLLSPRLCHGWVAVMGFDSIGVRIACARGEITADLVRSGSSIPLFDDFSSMMRANGIDTDELQRNRLIRETQSNGRRTSVY